MAEMTLTPTPQKGAEKSAKSDVKWATFELVHAIEEWQSHPEGVSFAIRLTRENQVIEAKDILRAALAAMGGTE